MPKRKLKSMPGAYVNGKPQPSLYTDDPNIAPAKTLNDIAANFDKARQSMRGKPSELRQAGGYVVADISPADTSSPDAAIASIKASASAARKALSGEKPTIKAVGKKAPPLPSAVRSGRTKPAGKGVRTVPKAVVSGGKVVSKKISADYSKMANLTDAQRKSLSMEKQRLNAIGEVAEENEYFGIIGDAIVKKQMVEPEQNRMRALYRRYDHYFHPQTFTLGGADHWAEDPSARLSGRSHVSVNVHSSYVSIPASLQAVSPVVNYTPTGPTTEERNQASRRERLFYAWWDSNELDLKLEEACLLKSLYGTTAAKVYWDPVKKIPRLQIVDTPENLYLGYGTSDYSRIDWALYSYGISPQTAIEDYGINVIPVNDGNKWYPYTSASTHDDPIASIYLNSYHRDPIRYQTAYDQMKIEVMDYWYKHPTQPGKPPLVCNAIIVGNTVVKKTEHPELEGVIPYVILRNSLIPGSPYGKPELYDIEQLLREKDEKITAQAQMIHSVVGGQMWQLVGAEAPDEVPANAIPKPNQVATPGAGNRIESINPFIPQFQVEDYNKRIDRELAVVSGLNDLLLGLAPR